MCGVDLSTNIKRSPGAVRPEAIYLQMLDSERTVATTWHGLITDAGWKYVAQGDSDQGWMLHNLQDDPFEQVNRLHQPPAQAKRQEMADQLQTWREKVNDK
jgi:hypothetical protein